MSPVSRGRKPKKRPKTQHSRRARPPTDVARVERWPRLLRAPVELSGCVVQGEPDQEHRILAVAYDRDERPGHRFETAYGGFGAGGGTWDGDRPDAEDTADLLEEFGVAGGFEPAWFDPMFITARLARLR